MIVNQISLLINQYLNIFFHSINFVLLSTLKFIPLASHFRYEIYQAYHEHS